MSRPSLSELRAAFAETLSAARNEAERSLAHLARAAGLPMLRINAYEAGTLLPDLEDLYALAGALNVHPAELLPVFDRGGEDREAGDPERGAFVAEGRDDDGHGGDESGAEDGSAELDDEGNEEE